MGHSKSSSKREVYSNSGLTQEMRKILNKQPNFPSKGTRKRSIKPKVHRRKEIIKMRAEVNKIETKKEKEKLSETKSCFFFKDKQN